MCLLCCVQLRCVSAAGSFLYGDAAVPGSAKFETSLRMPFSLKPAVGLVLVLLIIALPICGHLDHMPILQWDEARLANNALEMYHNDNWIVTYYDGSPDMWNTKPPLMIWLQVVSMHLFGIGELAIRFPSAVAAIATCVLLYWLLGYKLRKPLAGLITVLVLITSEGFIRYHVVRTGDYDALLVLFTTATGVFFYLLTEQMKLRYLYAFFAALTLAFFTKGIPALIFLPPMVLYAAWRRSLVPLLRNKHSYIAAGIFLVLTGGYYLLREHYNPGYLQAVLYNDITGRYLHTDMDNGNDLTFYLRQMADLTFQHWYLLAIPAIVMGAMQKDDGLRRLAVLSGALALFQLIIISKAQTKNAWYDASVYPFLAIVVGLLLYGLCVMLYELRPAAELLKRNALPAALLLLVFTKPYIAIVDKSISPHYPGNWDDESIGFYLKNLYHDRERQPEAALIWNDNSAEILWYLKVLRETNRPIVLAKKEKLQPGDKIMTYGEGTGRYLDTTYKAQVIKNAAALAFLQIDSVKKR